MEAPPHHSPVAAERVELGEHLFLEARVFAGGIDLDAGVEAGGENHSIGQRGPEPGWHGEPVLGVEAVIVVAAKRQPWVLFCVGPRVRAAKPLKALDRSGEVGGASPPRSLGQIESPRYPTDSHFATQVWS